MSDDFEIEPEFDIDEDLSDDILEFDSFDTEYEDVTLRTAILQKENMTALLCIKSAPVGAAICRVDPREQLPAVQLYDDPVAALHWYTRSLRTSRQNGWNLVYDGLPLNG
jgi:hypothetical protein